MKKLIITGIALLVLSACATAPRPMMANGERCKDPYETEYGRYVTCERQKRLVKLDMSREKDRATVERARARIEKQNEEYEATRSCDQIIISSSGEELCVIQQD